MDVYPANKRHETVLHVAARKGHEAIVDMLLWEDTLDASMRNGDANIALHIAARKGDS